MDKENNRPLHYAVRSGSIPLLKKLLQNGFDVNERGPGGSTPLHAACQLRKVDCVEVLLQNGSNVYIEDDDGLLPGDVLQEFMDNFLGPTAYVKELEKELHNEIEVCFKIIKLLIAYGYKSDSTENFRCREAHTFARYGPKETVECLIKAGNDILMVDKDGNSLLHSAVTGDHEDNTRDLLNYINVDCQSKTNETALHVAAIEGSHSCIGILLESGAEIDTVNEKNFTPLCCAITSNRPFTDKIVELLLQWKCEIPENAVTLLNEKKTIIPKLHIVDRRLIEIKEKSVYKHILKRMAADLNVNNWSVSSVKDFFKDIDDINYAAFLEEHRNEVESMKNKMIARKLSVYDFISRNKNDFARYLNNPLVREFFTTKLYLKEFPLYSDYLETSYKMASCRKPLLLNAEVVLLNTCSSIPLPYTAVKIIVEGLTNQDLKCLLK